MPKEKCVYCDKLTDVDKNEHIDNRMYYILGAGQLCKKCYNKIYSCS